MNPRTEAEWEDLWNLMRGDGRSEKAFSLGDPSQEIKWFQQWFRDHDVEIYHRDCEWAGPDLDSWNAAGLRHRAKLALTL